MRPAFIVTLLLLLPIAQGLSPSFTPENFNGNELVLVKDDGFWSQEEWGALAELGYTPLRMLSPAEVLTWKSHDAVKLTDFSQKTAPQVQFKGDMMQFEQHQHLRLVFEPRLPAYAVSQIVSMFTQYGIDIEPNFERYNSVLPHVEIVEWSHDLSALSSIDGLLWVEPVLETHARNEQVSSLLQHGYTTGDPAWNLGVNGNGIVIAVADSGLDADHACFRNATAAGEFGSEGENMSDGIGAPGEGHRKILLLNHSIDTSDTPGHSDYRHGTHVAGTLSCYNVYDMRNSSVPKNGSSLAYASKLIFQDIVSDEGWVPPDVDALLVEAGLNGATVHSNSWGDATTAYTARTGDFDAWAAEMPWSLSFIAPGNNGGQLLEPANGRNVVAVGASEKSESSDRWSASSIGPTELGTNGIFALAVGTSVQSARADGVDDSYNDALRSSSGTSMATPAAASVAALLQQMVEQGWISGKENRTSVPLNTVRQDWVNADKNLTNNLSLAEGFSPSGALLRALMSLAVTPLPQDVRNGGAGGYDLQNTYDGWGQLNLSALVDFNAIEQNLHLGDVSPLGNVWIHDSYRLVSQTPQSWLQQRQGNLEALENLIETPWNGSDAVGPFLKTGEIWVERFDLHEGDFDARLAWNAAPEPYLVDDLQLVVRLSDGRIALANSFQNDGYSTLYDQQIADFTNHSAFPMTNETTVAVSLSEEDLSGVEWVEVEVRARYVSPGNQNNSIGIDGNQIGFALAVDGVKRDSNSWEDGDGDGVANRVDGCPNQNASGWDINEDGCIDDADGDLVGDNIDVCPLENATHFDRDSDGCIDDSDADGVYDNIDVCLTSVVSIFWPVDSLGCRPVDSLPIIDFTLSPEDGGEWYDVLLVEWSVVDEDADLFDTGASIHVLNATSTGGSYSIASCLKQNVGNGTYSCSWIIPNDLPVWDISDQELQIEIHAQSRNSSPEGKRDVVLLRDDAVFSSNWKNPLLEVDDALPSANEGVVSQNRAFLWGVLGILAGFVLMYQLSWNIREKKDQENVRPAFEHEAVRASRSSTDENE